MARKIANTKKLQEKFRKKNVKKYLLQTAGVQQRRY